MTQQVTVRPDVVCDHPGFRDQVHRERPGHTGEGTTGTGTTPSKEFHVEVTGFIAAIVIGLIIGALGRLVVPGKQDIPLWLTLLIGVFAAILGTLLAGAIGVAETGGIDWIELALQIALAAGGVVLATTLLSRRAS
jgi:uncharacterized membrane protein YeaQ/YmgE (transglycosylase-associated protein family)